MSTPVYRAYPAYRSRGTPRSFWRLEHALAFARLAVWHVGKTYAVWRVAPGPVCRVRLAGR
jgi:hypothetical protein